jgi:hypothetical protein
MIVTRTALTVGLITVLVPSVISQYTAGDLVVNGLQCTLFGVTSQARVYTVTSWYPNLARAQPLACAPDNRAIWAVLNPSPLGPNVVSVAQNGTITTLQMANMLQVMDFDGAGNAILRDTLSGTTILKFRAGRLTTLYSNLPFQFVGGGSIELATGDLIATSWNPAGILRFSLHGAPRWSTVMQLIHGPQRVVNDPETGGMLGITDYYVFHATLGPTPSVTPLVWASGGLRFGWPVRDPRDGRYIIPYHTGRNPLLLRLDARTKAVTTLVQLPRSVVNSTAVAIAGSRHLCGLNDARPGGLYSMLVSSPNEAGAPYTVALSFGFRPGIPVGGGRKIYLSPDPLFLASATGRGPFYGFQGTLDARGEAVAAVAIPNLAGLSGRRFFASAVTVVKNRISVVSDPLGVTIQ